MERFGLLADGGVLYLACGIPLAILGGIYGSPFAVNVGILLALMGIFFLLAWAVAVQRRRSPRVNVE